MNGTEQFTERNALALTSPSTRLARLAAWARRRFMGEPYHVHLPENSGEHAPENSGAPMAAAHTPSAELILSPTTVQAFDDFNVALKAAGAHPSQVAPVVLSERGDIYPHQPWPEPFSLGCGPQCGCSRNHKADADELPDMRWLLSSDEREPGTTAKLVGILAITAVVLVLVALLWPILKPIGAIPKIEEALTDLIRKVDR